MADKLPPIHVIGEKQVPGLGKSVLSILAVGLTAGLTLIAAAKRVGELITEDEDDK